MRHIWLYILIAFILGCKKPEDRPCFKGAGEETEITLDVGDFNMLYLGPHLNYVLIQDTVNHLVVKGGENLVDHLKTSVVENRLFIENENKCNFLRSYKKEISVEIHFIDMFNIEFNGTKSLICSDTIFTNYLTLTMKESAGTMNIITKAISLHLVVEKNWGNFNVEGEVDYLKINAAGNGFGTTYDLAVQDSIHVLSRSAEDIKINANGVKLRSEAYSNGDIWYVGTPSSIDHESIGEGLLIDKN